MKIDEILAERGERYAKNGYGEVALVSQNIKAAMKHSTNWNRLPADMRESLEMVASKISRILNGDPAYLDSWVDCIGYLQLVVERLERCQNAKPDVLDDNNDELRFNTDG